MMVIARACGREWAWMEWEVFCARSRSRVGAWCARGRAWATGGTDGCGNGKRIARANMMVRVVEFRTYSGKWATLRG